MESSWILVWKTAAWAAWRSNDLSVLVALQLSIRLQLNLPKNTFYLECASSGNLQLKQAHPYYAQVQGKMAIVGTEWCDFVVYTPVCLHVERVLFDYSFWEDTLFPSLQKFVRNHVLPELVTATHFHTQCAPRLSGAAGGTELETSDEMSTPNDSIIMEQEST